MKNLKGPCCIGIKCKTNKIFFANDKTKNILEMNNGL